MKKIIMLLGVTLSLAACGDAKQNACLFATLSAFGAGLNAASMPSPYPVTVGQSMSIGSSFAQEEADRNPNCQ